MRRKYAPPQNGVVRGGCYGYDRVLSCVVGVVMVSLLRGFGFGGGLPGVPSPFGLSHPWLHNGVVLRARGGR